ncbi:MAG: hypothetical protein QNI87_08830 [Erythrobacter sp.]|uniref:hypothetical protein n=1 Tax=Erythrobacter sp. TaxID=1042 RepID=UPI00262340D6|nr:hypothetical protein [Erythrobacter sp.]MDJ0978628.1 hypothetical protein [Erythrobacter sp.]
MPDPLNLTGKWGGVFSYPSDYAPTTPFLADIIEEAGAFSGTTIEPDLYSDSPANARITGHRSGRSVDFTKVYPGRRDGYANPVDYVGQLSEDGLVITGVWSLLQWNGEFEMTRETGLQVAEEERAEVEV